MNDSLNKTAFMTVTEYIEKITPVFKEFNKFIKKNEKFFKKAEFYGVVYLTYPEYFDREMARLLKGNHKILANKEYIDECWLSNSSSRVTEDAPKDIKEKYSEYLTFFKENFGEKNITKIENDELKSNKRSVRRAIDADVYVDALKDEVISTKRLDEIFSSVGLKIPKHILQLKNKIETQGYSRSVENFFLKKTAEFENILRVALKPYYEDLKNIRKRDIMAMVNKFENEFGGQKEYEFFQSYKNKSYREIIKTRFRTFFKGDYEKEGEFGKKYIYKRVPNFDKLLEEKATDFAEEFVKTFIFRINEKLKVVTDKLGSPEIEVGNVSFSSGQFEGMVKVTYPNGVKLTIEAEVIIAGGYIQVEHYRYLLKPFYKGKFIDLENIDNLNFN